MKPGAPMAEQKGRTKMGEEKAGGAARGTAQHTPGPWRLFNKVGTLAIHKGPKPVVAWPGFDSADVGGHDINVANAKLIVHAPDLADQLEEAVSILRALRIGRQPPVKLLDCIDTSTAILRAAGRLASPASAPKEPPDPPSDPEATPDAR